MENCRPSKSLVFWGVRSFRNESLGHPIILRALMSWGSHWGQMKHEMESGKRKSWTPFMTMWPGAEVRIVVKAHCLLCFVVSVCETFVFFSYFLYKWLGINLTVESAENGIFSGTGLAWRRMNVPGLGTVAAGTMALHLGGRWECPHLQEDSCLLLGRSMVVFMLYASSNVRRGCIWEPSSQRDVIHLSLISESV